MSLTSATRFFYGILFVLCVSCMRIDLVQVSDKQAASIAGLPDRPVAGETLNGFFGPRTAYLIPDNGVKIEQHGPDSIRFSIDPISGSGRAAAISEDGYFLTARHVIASGTPIFLDGPYGVVQYRGRVVRIFPPADLALVKFDRTSKHFFELSSAMPKQGEILFAAATDGYGSSNEENLTWGNPNFAASGVIGSIRDGFVRNPVSRIYCNLPARPGMSGSPLANKDGKLIGIITAGRYQRTSGAFVGTIGWAIDGSYLQSVIAEDRAKNPSTVFNRPVVDLVGVTRTEFSTGGEQGKTVAR